MQLFQHLPERERRLVVAAVVIVALISVVLLVEVPLYSNVRQMERRSGEEEKRLQSIIGIAKEYLSVRDEVEEIRRRAFNGSGGSVSGIESIVVQSGLKRKMVSVRPTRSAVGEGISAIRAEVLLERISLSDVSRLVAVMESDSHPMAIEKIVIKATYEDAAAFNATLIVNTVERE
jgi:hypothetical protein